MKFSTAALVMALTTVATTSTTTTTTTADAFAFVGGSYRHPAPAFVGSFKSSASSSSSAVSYRMDPEQELFERELLMDQQFHNNVDFGHAVVRPRGPPPMPPPMMSPEEAAAAAAAEAEAFHQQQQEIAEEIRRGQQYRQHHHHHHDGPLKGRSVVDDARREQFANNDMSSQPVVGTINDIFSTTVPKKIQGNGSLKTWTVREQTERVQVLLKSKHDMPMRAELEVWNGPENVPFKLHTFSENGSQHPLSLVVNTPDIQNAVAIKNIGQLEFPLEGTVLGDSFDGMAGRAVDELEEFGEYTAAASASSSSSHQGSEKEPMNGESVESYSFSPHVEAVQILLKSTKGRPLHARVEITQGPGHVKQYLDVYSENGTEQPLFCVLDTPGSVFGSSVRIVNTGTMVFPFKAYVEPYLVTDKYVPPPRSGNKKDDCGHGRGDFAINKNVQVDTTDNSFIV